MCEGVHHIVCHFFLSLSHFPSTFTYLRLVHSLQFHIKRYVELYYGWRKSLVMFIYTILDFLYYMYVFLQMSCHISKRKYSAVYNTVSELFITTKFEINAVLTLFKALSYKAIVFCFILPLKFIVNSPLLQCMVYLLWHAAASIWRAALYHQPDQMFRVHTLNETDAFA